MLAGKRVLIVGASRGIGRATALACARAGAVVGVGYRRGEAEARAVVDEIAAAGGRARALGLDAREPAEVDEAVARLRAEEGRIDGLVCSAGVFRAGLLAAADPGELRELVDVNLFGAIACARAVLPVMLEQRGGVIVLVGSAAAARPARGQSVYLATKAGVEALARALAVEYGRKGIRALCVRPGPIATDMLAGTRAVAEEEIVARTALRRVGRPEEVGEVIAFLLSDRAGYVTGTTIDIDGGYAVS